MSELSQALPAQSLAALNAPGLRPTSLGNYLASLGLVCVAARRWPAVRLCWREDVPCLVGGPGTLDDLAGLLIATAEGGTWTSYDLSWQEEQKTATKQKTGEPIALWRSKAREEDLLRLDAHIVAATRLFFNPMLGSGGNAGKRNFAEGWKKARAALQQPAARSGPSSRSKKQRSAGGTSHDLGGEVAAWLTGAPVALLLEKLQAASWFSDANKMFNSGQNAAREGQISPWAMLLACEGLGFFAGGPSRRLGAKTRPTGAFPFVTSAAAPSAAGEAGRDRGEVWAPIWTRPASCAEVRAIFSRGRAEVAGRGAVTPAAFVTAVLRRGIDAGVACFIRFALSTTTSANTFEARRLERIVVPPRDSLAPEDAAPGRTCDESRTDLEPGRGLAEHARAVQSIGLAFERLVGLIDRLPRDTKKGKRWLYRGVRGPVETAIVRCAANPGDAGGARALVDTVVVAIDRVDHSRAFRKSELRWLPLPLDWLPVLLGETPCPEARLAAAIVSSFPAQAPFTLYRYGAEMRRVGSFIVPETPPSRWGWSSADVTTNLVQVIDRFTIDLQNDEATEPGGPHWRRLGWHASQEDVDAWLSRAVDEELLVSWLSRMALFDWRSLPRRPEPLGVVDRAAPLSGALAIHALLSPLLDQRPVRATHGNDLLSHESGARTASAVRRLVTLLRVGDLAGAVETVRSRYAVAGTRLATAGANLAVEEPRRLLASLLMTIPDDVRAGIICRRWLKPQRRQQ